MKLVLITIFSVLIIVSLYKYRLSTDVGNSFSFEYNGETLTGAQNNSTRSFCGSESIDDLVRSNALIKEGELEKAEEILVSILDKNGDCVAAIMSLSTIFYYRKEYDKASQGYFRALDLDNSDTNIYQSIGALYLKVDPPKGIRYFEEALKIDSKNDDAVWGLAVAYSSINEYELTKKYFNIYISRNPNSERSQEAKKYVEHMESKL